MLETIERTGRPALGEMRRLVGMLRRGDEEILLAPQPSVASLPELCVQVRSAGLPVELTVDGPPVPVPPGVDVSAYRIVQEALTNALKHSGAAGARVTVRYGHRELAVEVVDDGHGPLSKGTVGAGHGLVGMRERASIYGGELHAGARPGGALRLLTRGLSNAELSAELLVSEATAKTHVARVLMKLGVRDRVQAVIAAYESGLVQPGARR